MKNILTKKSVRILKDELHDLLANALPKIAEQLQEAREHGDLKENAEYTVAKNQQSIVNSRVEEIRRILEDYTPAENLESTFDGEHAALNTKVHFSELDSPTVIQVVKLVSPYEAEPLSGKVSTTSALGKSLLDCKAGETLYIKGENLANPYQVKIVKVDGS